MTIKCIKDSEEKANMVQEVLADLPEWFGLPDSTAAYIEEAKVLPMWAAFSDDQVIGFLTVKETSPDTLELHCTGVKKVWHRKGIGRALFEAMMSDQGVNYSLIQVKTVAKGHYAEYDQTNAFYNLNSRSRYG